MHAANTDRKIFFTRVNKDVAATEDEIKSFEKTAISDLNRGMEVFIIEKFPKKFFYFARLIRLEKVSTPVSSLSEAENAQLYKAVSTNSIFG